MQAFSFVHAADLHLDTPFVGLSLDAEAYPAIADAVRRATFTAFDTLVRHCLDDPPAFAVFAGDVYDCEERSVRAQLHLRDGLARLAQAGVRSFLAHGNHDPYEERSRAVAWPVGVHVFGCEAVESLPVEVGDATLATVSGVSYRTRNERRKLFGQFHPPEPPAFHVAVLHCNVGSNTGHEPYVPCELADLVGAGFDYWALGHVHARAQLHCDPYVVYPGNTQGRSVRELGPRGYYRVHVREDRTVENRFVACDAVRWVRLEVDIGPLTTLDALDRALAEAAESAAVQGEGRPVVARVCLTGRGPLYRELRRPDPVGDLLTRLRETAATWDPFVWVEKIEVACRPEIDLAARREGHDLLAQVLRVADELRSEPGLARREAEQALGALYGRAGLARDLSPPDDAALAELLARAELCCADLLGETE